MIHFHSMLSMNIENLKELREFCPATCTFHARRNFACNGRQSRFSAFS